MLNRTFGCVRLVWNRTLAWRRARYRSDGQPTSFPTANAYLTAMKRDPELAFLSEVSSVPLQQALRIQHTAFANFFARRARYPRFKSRVGRQSAEYTRSGFRCRNGKLLLAKMATPLAFVWSWPEIDPTTINPSTVTVSRDPCGRWYVSFAVDVADPEPLAPAGAVVGVDLGITNFAVTSDGNRIPNPRLLEHKARNMVRNRRLACAISDCGWGSFRRTLGYKAARAGRRLIVVDRWFPSSKTCSECGHLLADRKSVV